MYTPARNFVAFFILTSMMYVYACGGSTEIRDNPRSTEIRDNPNRTWDQIGEEIDPALGTATRVWMNDKNLINEREKNYTIYSDQLSLDYSKFKQDESNLLKMLSDEQLEYFSKYEEAIKDGSASRKELYLRKIINSLSPEKLNELRILNQRSSDLEKKKEYSIKEYNDIKNEMENLDKRKYALFEYARSITYRKMSGSSSTVNSENHWQAVSKGLQSLSDSFKQKSEQTRQQLMMNQINNSLRDIASSIRGR